MLLIGEFYFCLSVRVYYGEFIFLSIGKVFVKNIIGAFNFLSIVKVFMKNTFY